MIMTRPCKRRSNNPSLKRPDFPVAPEQKSGSRYPFALGVQRVGDEGRGFLGAFLGGSDRGADHRAAARRFGIDPRTVAKMLRLTAPPGYVAQSRRPAEA